MTRSRIVACQLGAALAVRTSHASVRQVGVLSNRHLLRGVAFALAFAAATIYAPPLKSIFKTAALPPHDLLILASFPVIVWGSDEFWRWRAQARASQHGRQIDRTAVQRDAGATPGLGPAVTDQ